MSNNILSISSIITSTPAFQTLRNLQYQPNRAKIEKSSSKSQFNDDELKNAILAYTQKNDNTKDTKKDEATIPSKDVIKTILEEFKYGTQPTADKESKILGGSMAKFKKGAFLDTNDGNRIYFKFIKNEKGKNIGIIYHVEKLEHVDKQEQNYESVKDMIDTLKKRYHMKDESIINTDEIKSNKSEK